MPHLRSCSTNVMGVKLPPPDDPASAAQTECCCCCAPLVVLLPTLLQLLLGSMTLSATEVCCLRSSTSRRRFRSSFSSGICSSKRLRAGYPHQCKAGKGERLWVWVCARTKICMHQARMHTSLLEETTATRGRQKPPACALKKNMGDSQQTCYFIRALQDSPLVLEV